MDQLNHLEELFRKITHTQSTSGDSSCNTVALGVLKTIHSNEVNPIRTLLALHYMPAPTLHVIQHVTQSYKLNNVAVIVLKLLVLPLSGKREWLI